MLSGCLDSFKNMLKVWAKARTVFMTKARTEFMTKARTVFMTKARTVFMTLTITNTCYFVALSWPQCTRKIKCPETALCCTTSGFI